MSYLSAEQLAQRLGELKLVDRAELRALETRHDLRTLSGPDYLQLLLRRDLLTNYQVDRLLRGEKQGYFYGKYKVLYPIAQGSFARVYRASEEGTGKTFAVKVLRKRYAQEQEIRDRFRREGELGRTMKHPNIVPIYDVYSKGTTQFIVLEFVEGPNLREFLTLRKKVSAEEATRLMRDVASGLFYAFTRGLAHRDLKLTNVLVSTKGQARLIDFGLAGADDAMGQMEVNVGDNARTVDYAALEKVTNVKKGDPRSDIFFAGCMYYHLLTGQPALTETTDSMRKMVKSRFTDIRPIQSLEPTLPWVVTKVVNRALEISAAMRYQTPGEMLVDLATTLKSLETGLNLGPPSKALREEERGTGTDDDTATVTRGPTVRVAADSPSKDSVSRDSVSRDSMSKDSPSKESSSTQPTVLVVESDLALQNAFREKLRKHGYRVLMISDLQRGIERAGDEFDPVEAVVVNAGTLGREALIAFNTLDERLQTKGMPAILVLGEKQGDWRHTAQLGPTRAVLTMPFRMREFVDTIKLLVPPETARTKPGETAPGGRPDPASKDSSLDEKSKSRELSKSKEIAKSKKAGVKSGSKSGSKDSVPKPMPAAAESSQTVERPGFAAAARGGDLSRDSHSASIFEAHMLSTSAQSSPTGPDDRLKGSRSDSISTKSELYALKDDKNPAASSSSTAGAGSTALAGKPKEKSDAGSSSGSAGGFSTAPIQADGSLGIVDNYQLMEELGQGGMGTVYKARHMRLKRIVAIKILSADRVSSRRAVARFHREIKAVARLDHPNIVRAHDAGEAEGRHYLVMEYIKGIDLSDLVKRCGPLPVPEACELIRQAAVGLEHACENAMVHRDIKPSNLVLESRNAELKILDLGLALLHVEAGAPGEELTGSGQVLGTVEYMAPEQWSDTHRVDIRADIYSLGCTAYRLLSGHAPYSGAAYANMLQKMMAHAQAPIPSIRDRRPDVLPELAVLLEKMLAKDPARRFQRPKDVADALAPFAAAANLPRLIARAESIAPTSRTRDASSDASS